MIGHVSWNPSTNAWVCHVSDPDGDWTAVCVDGKWSIESAGLTITNVRTLRALDDAVADYCARGAN